MPESVPNGRDELPELFNIAVACCDKWVEQGHGDRPAIHDGDEVISYGDLSARVDRLGNGLESLGLGPGDRYLIRLPATPDFYTAFLAGLKIGSVAIPTPLQLRERELRYIMTTARVRAVITEETLADPIRSIRHEVPTLEHLVCLATGDRAEVELSSLVGSGDSRLVARRTTPNDPAFVLFSSGTTGVPKGIAHAHRGFGLAAGDPCGRFGMKLDPTDVVLQPHDPSWSYSLGCGFLFPLCEGASIVATHGMVRPENVLQWVERHRVTILGAVPTFYRAVLSRPGIEDTADISSLRYCTSAGEPLTVNTFHEWRERMGVLVLDHIGQGETSMFCANTPGRAVVPGSVGRPLPGYRVAVLDDEGREVVGEVGELAIKDDNPALFYDYLGMPERWEATHRDGWYLTGDLARVDDEGNFWYVSRSDDLITSRGYLISPKEVEDTLVDHPAVLEAAVVGQPDERIGQVVIAYVALQAGYEPGPELANELIDHARKEIAPFKTPKRIEFLEELPKTPTGKILRRDLRLRG
ncbi:MAG: acyl-CoA synthetase [Acidimicrobiia bacterium]